MTIQPIVMPKWGLAMQEGTLTAWLVAAGDSIAPGTEVAEIETSKITNALELTVAGTVRRLVADVGATLPVAALLAVVAEPATSDAEIDAFVAQYQERFAKEAAAASAAAPVPAVATVNGRRIQYLKVGQDAPAVLMIHGFGGDHLTWMFNQQALADGATVYAIDLPGHGASAKDVGAGDLGLMVETAIAFLDAVGVTRAHLVGHSMGGAIALAAALRHPDRVASVSALAPGGLGPEVNMRFIDGFVTLEKRRDARPLLELLVADKSKVSREMVEEVLKYKRLDGVTEALRTIAGKLFAGGRQGTGLRDQLGRLTVPAQVIWGVQDEVLPVAHASGLPAAIAVHLLPGAGHLPHMEAAGEVNRLVAAMIAR